MRGRTWKEEGKDERKEERKEAEGREIEKGKRKRK